MRTYRVTETRPNGLPSVQRTYNGFDRNFRDLASYNHVALIMEEGNIEVFVIEDPHKAADFLAYLADYHADATLLGIFHR